MYNGDQAPSDFRVVDTASLRGWKAQAVVPWYDLPVHMYIDGQACWDSGRVYSLNITVVGFVRCKSYLSVYLSPCLSP